MKMAPFLVATRQQKWYLEISVDLRKVEASLENYIQSYTASGKESVQGAAGAQIPLPPGGLCANVPDHFLSSPV